jgi:hypothetical protein
MRLLVSMCSRTEQAPECLIACDPDRQLIEPLAVPDPAFGAFGLCLTPSTLYSVFDLGRPTNEEPERSELRAIDPATFRVRWRYAFKLGRDVHSILADGEAMYAVSTGTDELLRLGLDADGGVSSEEIVWRPDSGERADRHHLNDVAVVGGQLLVSGFGPRPGPKAWEDARDGFVQSVDDGSVVLGPLYHPHSICDLGSGEFAVCESPRRRIVTSAGRISGPFARVRPRVVRRRKEVVRGNEPQSASVGTALDPALRPILHSRRRRDRGDLRAGSCHPRTRASDRAAPVRAGGLRPRRVPLLAVSVTHLRRMKRAHVAHFSTACAKT